MGTCVSRLVFFVAVVVVPVCVWFACVFSCLVFSLLPFSLHICGVWGFFMSVCADDGGWMRKHQYRCCWDITTTTTTKRKYDDDDFLILCKIGDLLFVVLASLNQNTIESTCHETEGSNLFLRRRRRESSRFVSSSKSAQQYVGLSQVVGDRAWGWFWVVVVI